MNIKTIVWTIGKLFIGGLAFFAATILGGMLAGRLGLPLPVMPAEIDPAKVGQSLPLIGVLMAGVLSVFSIQMQGRFLTRWLILSLFSWIVYGLNTYLEAKIFTPSMATSYVLVMNLIACLGCSVVVAWLFRPAPTEITFWSKARAFFAARPAVSWTWRLLAGLAAFPAVYFVCGWIVAPFVLPYYQQQYAGLALPTQTIMLGVASLRSLLYLLSILPVLIAWKGGRMGLFMALGVVLFMLVGGLSMLQAIWLPPSLRGAHSLEMLADSFVHAAALVFLLVPVSSARPGAIAGMKQLEAR